MAFEFVVLAILQGFQLVFAGQHQAAAVGIDLVDRGVTQTPFGSPLRRLAADQL